MSQVNLPKLPKPSTEMSQSEIFNFLASIDIDLFAEVKKNNKYIQWATAWQIISRYFDATYKICQFNGKDYSESENGVLVRTEVTINGNTLPMVISLRDASNKCQKSQDYDYVVTTANKQITKTCKAFTAFDVTNAHMRCLTKNLSMFGLGLTLYQTKEQDYTQEEGTTDTQEKENIQSQKNNVVVVTEPVSSDNVLFDGHTIDQLIEKCRAAKSCDDIRFIGNLLRTNKALAKTKVKNIYIAAFKALPDFQA